MLFLQSDSCSFIHLDNTYQVRRPHTQRTLWLGLGRQNKRLDKALFTLYIESQKTAKRVSARWIIKPTLKVAYSCCSSLLSLILKDVGEDSFTSFRHPRSQSTPITAQPAQPHVRGGLKRVSVSTQRVFYCDRYIELLAGEFTGCPVGTGRVFPSLFILLVVEDRRPRSDGGVCWANGEEKYCAQAEL